MSAKDLLIKLLEYNFLWKSHEQSKPSMLRREQIECLLEAFELTKNHVNPSVKSTYSFSGIKGKISRKIYLSKLSNIEYLEKGEFIKDIPYEEYQELSLKAINKIDEVCEHIPESRMNKPVDIGWMFSSLYNFRQKIYNLTYPNGGMLEGFSVGLIYSKYLQSELKKVVNNNLEDIDIALWSILDPQKREIDIDILKNKYNYEDVDFTKIDLEWRMDNY